MAGTKVKYRRTSKGTKVAVKGLAAKLALVENSTMRSDTPQFRAGDTVRVHVRIKEGEKERIQIYEGVVIGRRHGGGSRSFVVRKMSHGVGVERIFLETSPKVAKIEVVQAGRVRRAKLYYVRERQGKAARIDRLMDKVTDAPQEPSAPAKK